MSNYTPESTQNIYPYFYDTYDIYVFGKRQSAVVNSEICRLG